MSHTVELPALGESVTEGTVTRWLVAVGDTVAVDDPIVEVSTDKVDTEIPSPVAGVVEQILVEEDEDVEVGAALVVIGDGSSAPAAAPAAPTAEAPAASAPAAPEAPAAGSASGQEVTLPALGESVTEGTVTRWLKEVGEQVEVDEPLVEVSTDKVDTEVPSPVAGTLLEIRIPEDEDGGVPAGVQVSHLDLLQGQGHVREAQGRGVAGSRRAGEGRGEASPRGPAHPGPLQEGHRDGVVDVNARAQQTRAVVHVPLGDVDQLRPGYGGHDLRGGVAVPVLDGCPRRQVGDGDHAVLREAGRAGTARLGADEVDETRRAGGAVRATRISRAIGEPAGARDGVRVDGDPRGGDRHRDGAARQPLRQVRGRSGCHASSPERSGEWGDESPGNGCDEAARAPLRRRSASAIRASRPSRRRARCHSGYIHAGRGTGVKLTTTTSMQTTLRMPHTKTGVESDPSATIVAEPKTNMSPVEGIVRARLFL